MLIVVCNNVDALRCKTMGLVQRDTQLQKLLTKSKFTLTSVHIHCSHKFLVHITRLLLETIGYILRYGTGSFEFTDEP